MTHSCEIAEAISRSTATGELSAGNAESGDTMVIREQRFSFNQVRQALGSVLDHDLHAKRVGSLCDATLGVLRSASLAVCMIGQGLAAARGLSPKHRQIKVCWRNANCVRRATGYRSGQRLSGFFLIFRKICAATF